MKRGPFSVETIGWAQAEDAAVDGAAVTKVGVVLGYPRVRVRRRLPKAVPRDWS
jgi:hypothetical protein